MIKDIASNLDCGNDCFYNHETAELIYIPHNLKDDFSDLEEFWDEELEKINKAPDSFIKIEVPASFESFKIMESFLIEVKDDNLKMKLSDALAKRHPFRNFKNLIDNSNYRNRWFDFKQMKLEEIVREQISGLD